MSHLKVHLYWDRMAKQTTEMRRATSCSTLSVIHILGKRWTIPIIETLYYAKGELSFNAMQTELNHITPKNLNDSLKELVGYGLVKKNEMLIKGSKHTNYILTKNGVTFEELAYCAKRLGGEMYHRPGCEFRQCKDCPLFK